VDKNGYWLILIDIDPYPAKLGGCWSILIHIQSIKQGSTQQSKKIGLLSVTKQHGRSFQGLPLKSTRILDNRDLENPKQTWVSDVNHTACGLASVSLANALCSQSVRVISACVRATMKYFATFNRVLFKISARARSASLTFWKSRKRIWGQRQRM
jgi:hypothetical protein